MLRTLLKFKYVTVSQITLKWFVNHEEPLTIAQQFDMLFQINGFGKRRIKFVNEKHIRGFGWDNPRDHVLYKTLGNMWKLNPQKFTQHQLIEWIKNESYKTYLKQKRLLGKIETPIAHDRPKLSIVPDED